MFLRYHSKSLGLIGVAPRISHAAFPDLADVERRIGRTLPESVHEWYSLDNACELLAKYSNDDPPVPRNKLGDNKSRLLVLRGENQGVCRWVLRLDGSDDPPVFVDQDFTDWEETWTPCTSRFSDYVYCCIWDFAMVLKDKPLIQAQHSELSATTLALLSREFERVTDSHGWPSDHQYRFQKLDQHILIWSGRGRTDWWLSAGSEESLAKLARAVWEYDGVGKSFWSTNEVGVLALRSIDGRDGRWPPDVERDRR